MKVGFKDTRHLMPSTEVNHIWNEPPIVYFDGVLTEKEISLLINSSIPRFSKSMIVGHDGKPAEDNTCSSDTAWLFTNENPAFEKIVSKITALAGFS